MFMYTVSRFRLSLKQGGILEQEEITDFVNNVQCNTQMVEDKYQFLLVLPEYSEIRKNIFHHILATGQILTNL